MIVKIYKVIANTPTLKYLMIKKNDNVKEANNSQVNYVVNKIILFVLSMSIVYSVFTI